MLEFFKDDGSAPASAHRPFQRWRSQHPDGFFLNVKARKDVSLHRTLCIHSGDVRWVPSRNQGKSLTRRTKVCSTSAQEPMDYTLREFAAPAKPCGDCKPGEVALQSASSDGTGRELPAGLAADAWDPEREDEAAEEEIRQRSDIGPTEKLNLLKARRGQGVYRAKLEHIESSCRLTGLLDRRHLRASHIKPWRLCDDQEKLDGCNGLLLSPHIDHLFDRGYISFSDQGDLMASKDLNHLVLEKWGIVLPRNVGAFRPEQCRYLEYHRTHVFEKTNGGRRKGTAEELELIESGEPAVVSPPE